MMENINAGSDEDEDSAEKGTSAEKLRLLLRCAMILLKSKDILVFSKCVEWLPAKCFTQKVRFYIYGALPALTVQT